MLEGHDDVLPVTTDTVTGAYKVVVGDVEVVAADRLSLAWRVRCALREDGSAARPASSSASELERPSRE